MIFHTNFQFQSPLQIIFMLKKLQQKRSSTEKQEKKFFEAAKGPATVKQLNIWLNRFFMVKTEINGFQIAAYSIFISNPSVYCFLSFVSCLFLIYFLTTSVCWLICIKRRFFSIFFTLIKLQKWELNKLGMSCRQMIRKFWRIIFLWIFGNFNEFETGFLIFWEEKGNFFDDLENYFDCCLCLNIGEWFGDNF